MSLIQARIIDSSWLRRFIYHLSLSIAYKKSDLASDRRVASVFWQALYFLADLAVFRPLKDKIGLMKIKYGFTSGAAVSPSLLRYFTSIGVNILQIYGISETGPNTGHRYGDILFESSGPPYCGTEIRISEEGEIRVRNDRLFVGYYKNEEAFRERVYDGWFCTGDLGNINDVGHLIFIDRMEDLGELTGGYRFSPQYAETRLRFSPYLKDAIVCGGENRDYVVAVIVIDLDNVGRWAEGRGIAYTTFTDLSQKDEVLGMIGQEIENLNKLVPDRAKIKKFANLYKELDADEAELTRTRKLRRSYVERRYDYLVEALYTDSRELLVDAPIVYRDGRKGIITTSIKLVQL